MRTNQRSSTREQNHLKKMEEMALLRLMRAETLTTRLILMSLVTGMVIKLKWLLCSNRRTSSMKNRLLIYWTIARCKWTNEGNLISIKALNLFQIINKKTIINNSNLTIMPGQIIGPVHRHMNQSIFNKR